MWKTIALLIIVQKNQKIQENGKSKQELVYALMGKNLKSQSINSKRKSRN